MFLIKTNRFVVKITLTSKNMFVKVQAIARTFDGEYPQMCDINSSIGGENGDRLNVFDENGMPILLSQMKISEEAYSDTASVVFTERADLIRYINEIKALLDSLEDTSGEKIIDVLMLKGMFEA